MHLLRITIAALSMVATVMTVSAQTFPTQPIRIVVPFPPGGGTDIIAREAAQRVTKATGWNFIVENRPGAGGNLGVDIVAKAKPDGYTLVLGQTSNLAINPGLYAKMPYDVQRDLSPVVLLAKSPLVMVTNYGSAFKSVADTVAAAKAKPGAVNFASSGNGTVSHLAIELFQKTAGVKMQHVPYKGANQGLVDVMGGNIDLYMSSVPTLLGQIKQGKLRALATTYLKRIDELPDVPTLVESGYPGFEASTWFGMLAPAGTPNDIVAKLNTEFNKALLTPEMRKRLADEGATPEGGSPGQFGVYIKDDTARWGKLIKDAGIKLE